MARKLAAVVFSIGCLQASSAFALGLGELKLESFLNEPLKASVDLLNMGGLHEDEVKVRLATREDFEKLGIERAYFLTSISFEVVADDKGSPRIIISSEESVLEPYLDFVLEARWPTGRLLREYTVLIDPPVFSEAATVVSASARVEEVEGIADPAKKKASEGAGSQVQATGTQVKVARSDLAPGEMPRRNFNAATSDQPISGDRYMIHRDQTLWDIASRAKPEGVSIHQTMLDIQRLNPDAFINGNINRIKAGYILYLPTAADISSADSTAAVAEVREQNAAWREGRDAERAAALGPALRISADSDADDEVDTDASGSQGQADYAATDGSGAQAPASQAESDSGDVAARLASMESELETMRRIVSLKDEQIVALQDALASAGSDGTDAVEELALAESADVPVSGSEATGPSESDVDASVVPDSESADTGTEEIAASAVASEQEEVEPPVVKTKAKTPAPAASSDGWMSYVLYGLAAIVIAVIGFVFVRRRKDEAEQDAVAAAAPADAFSSVKLREPPLEVEQERDDDALATDTREQSKASDRGYGQHKHDAYATDVESSDALAEADIYIAYGRHPQAIDLLNSALSQEPRNPIYRLKLIEVYTDLGDRGAATAQQEKLQSLGDANANAQAESILRRFEEAGDDAAPSRSELETVIGSVDEPGLAPNPLELQAQSGDALEVEFSGLEIEGSGADDEPGELDLSIDFQSPSEDDDEDLVIADDANGLSTKLDLARAYLDMGDDEGARQILEEVIAEGSDELKDEARTLLDRIG